MYRPACHDLALTTSLGNATVHYFEAGNTSKPTVLLLHEFPSSSNQFRDLIPLISDSYHVLAPDLSVFNLTKVTSDFVYTSDDLTTIIATWVLALNITSHAVYILDYGAPVGLRLAVHNLDHIAAIISQIGNAYDSGFGLEGKEKPNRQLDLFYDERNNLSFYLKAHEYFRTSQVPLLGAWGKGDPAFVPVGTEVITKDLPNAQINLLNAGHFALETKRWEIARLMKEFLKTVHF
ncbi:hypothetical protein LTR56_027310 [Elasticomyces elasticus]|nr:hypothetical protein LTR56_027310 [Elasticomyces elasticus]KAK3615570.1 hypothetical protein LTR22_027380 [Elasticomyces elasticus]KAK4908198.1 hypothetical protein LTR49_022884 [Elasticomyces elasticus]